MLNILKGLAPIRAWSILLLSLTLLLQLILAVKSGRIEKRFRKSKSASNRKNFFWDFWRLFRHSFPTFLSTESFGLTLLCVLVFKKALITIKLSRCVSAAGRHLVERKYGLLSEDIRKLGFLSIPATVTHVGIWYLRSLVKAKMADNLYRRISGLYFRDNNFYYCASESLVENPEKQLEGSTRLFCGTFMSLIENLVNPIIAICTLSYELCKLGGLFAPSFLINYGLLVGSIKSLMFPDLSLLMTKCDNQGGRLQKNHHNFIQHAEEIAFYCGEERERERIQRDLRNVIVTERKIKRTKFFLNVLDSLLTQHGGSFAGFVLCTLIVKERFLMNTSSSIIAENYLEASTLCVPLARSLRKFLLTNLKMAALTSSVERLTQFESCLLQLDEEKTDIKGRCNYIERKDKTIQFENVDIITPSKKCLIKNLSMKITQNKHVLIQGSNGSGKSAICRALTGLWPIERGTISKPNSRCICVSPNRVYFTTGCLKNQFTFPCDSSLVTDSEILEYAHKLGLDFVVERVGGLYREADWYNVLSGGERQRIGLARILIQNPTFAFLDESTSAISISDEGELYQTLKSSEITLISISQRPYLKEIHNVVMKLNENEEFTILMCDK